MLDRAEATKADAVTTPARACRNVMCQLIGFHTYQCERNVKLEKGEVEHGPELK